MTTQPEALRLAERLERYDADRSGYAKHYHAAAIELRRLHDSNQELLAALKAAKTIIGHPDDAHTRMIADAITKAERKTP